MAAFGAALPRLRRRVRHDLRLPGLPQQKVVAVIVVKSSWTIVVSCGSFATCRTCLVRRSFNTSTLTAGVGRSTPTRSQAEHEPDDECDARDRQHTRRPENHEPQEPLPTRPQW